MWLGKLQSDFDALFLGFGLGRDRYMSLTMRFCPASMVP